MRRLALGLLVAMILTAASRPLFLIAQSGSVLTVKIDGLPNNKPIVVAPMLSQAMSGKIAPPAVSTNLAQMMAGKNATADSTGAATVTFNLDPLGAERRRVQVLLDEDCVDGKTHVWLVQQGLQAPPECGKRRAVAWIWLDTGSIITIHAGSGTVDSTEHLPLLQNKYTWIGIGGLGALLGFTAFGGDDAPPATNTTTTTSSSTTTSSTTTSTTSTSTTTSTTTTAPVTFTSFNGIYSGTLNVGQNGCNFNTSAAVSGTLNVNTSGAGTWQKRHILPNILFAFNTQLILSGSQASMNATTVQSVNGVNYTVSDVATILGAIMTLQQTFQSQATPPCMTIYNGQVQRSPI